MMDGDGEDVFEEACAEGGQTGRGDGVFGAERGGVE